MKPTTIEAVKQAAAQHLEHLETNGIKMKDFSPGDRAIWFANLTIENSETELLKFRQRLEENPADAFEWASAAMEAAARLRLCVSFLVSSCEEREALPFTRLDEALVHAVSTHTNTLMRNHLRGSSTSAASNAMEGHMRSACAWFVESFEGYLVVE